MSLWAFARRSVWENAHNAHSSKGGTDPGARQILREYLSKNPVSDNTVPRKCLLVRYLRFFEALLSWSYGKERPNTSFPDLSLVMVTHLASGAMTGYPCLIASASLSSSMI